MNESKAPLSAGERQALESQLAQGHAELSAANAADAEKLGHIAAGHEVHTDANHVVLTPREVAEHRAVGSRDEVRV